MNELSTNIASYLQYCEKQKCLDSKTIKAYRIDLNQFSERTDGVIADITSQKLEQYLEYLHHQYKPRTVKRKIASLKAFFHYLEYRNIIEHNPFNQLQIHFREPVILPKIVPLKIVERFLSTIYKQQKEAKTPYQKRNALRDAAVFELLFATGIRISELCALTMENVNLQDGSLLIYGKGRKERRIPIGNNDIIQLLTKYKDNFNQEIQSCDHFFANQSGNALSDQCIRRIIHKYSFLAAIDLHITPHMFRHTFATSLLEADVDIRYIQEMLGHSSINITEIYTHVALAKQKDILSSKHPRNQFHL